MPRTRKLKTSKELEEEIKALQERLAKAKERENCVRFSVETRKRLIAIMENHDVTLTEGEINVLLNPCQNVERLYQLEKERNER